MTIEAPTLPGAGEAGIGIGERFDTGVMAEGAPFGGRCLLGVAGRYFPCFDSFRIS